MRRRAINAIFILLLALSPLLRAQDIKLPPDVEKLSAKAKETVEVSMDGPMLRWASKFLSLEDPEEQKAAKLVANLRGIYVRSFEFDKGGLLRRRGRGAALPVSFPGMVTGGGSPQRAGGRQRRRFLQTRGRTHGRYCHHL